MRETKISRAVKSAQAFTSLTPCCRCLNHVVHQNSNLHTTRKLDGKWSQLPRPTTSSTLHNREHKQRIKSPLKQHNSSVPLEMNLLWLPPKTTLRHLQQQPARAPDTELKLCQPDIRQHQPKPDMGTPIKVPIHWPFPPKCCEGNMIQWTCKHCWSGGIQRLVF